MEDLGDRRMVVEKSRDLEAGPMVLAHATGKRSQATNEEVGLERAQIRAVQQIGAIEDAKDIGTLDSAMPARCGRLR